MQRIFIDNHDRILYYSNPAGYIAEKEAVVDTMFQTQELERFLQKQALTIRWEDGVYDRLLLGQRGGRFDPEAPPLKSCRVWQLTRDSPINMRFIPYEALLERFGQPDRKHYETVYDGPMTRRRSTRSSATRFPATTADPSASRMCWSCTTPTAASSTTATVSASGRSSSHPSRKWICVRELSTRPGAFFISTSEMEERKMPKNQTKASTPVPAQGSQTPVSFDVRVYPVKDSKYTLANANVDINGVFAIRGVKVIRGEKGPFVAMPQYKDGRGDYHDICFPCTKEARQQFNDAVLNAYEQSLGQAQQPDNAPAAEQVM